MKDIFTENVSPLKFCRRSRSIQVRKVLRHLTFRQRYVNSRFGDVFYLSTLAPLDWVFRDVRHQAGALLKFLHTETL